jgi:hypothetical protein
MRSPGLVPQLFRARRLGERELRRGVYSLERDGRPISCDIRLEQTLGEQLHSAA